MAHWGVEDLMEALATFAKFVGWTLFATAIIAMGIALIKMCQAETQYEYTYITMDGREGVAKYCSSSVHYHGVGECDLEDGGKVFVTEYRKRLKEEEDV